MYCLMNDELATKMTMISEQDVSRVFLFRDQTYPGRCVVATKDHYREIFEIPPAVCRTFFEEVRQVARALHELFAPDKLNYAIYGDLQSHFHVHIVPKTADGPAWGNPFVLLSDPVVELGAEQKQERIDLIRRELAAGRV